MVKWLTPVQPSFMTRVDHPIVPIDRQILRVSWRNIVLESFDARGLRKKHLNKVSRDMKILLSII